MKNKIFLALLVLVCSFSCSDLEEELREDLTAEEAAKLVDVSSLLAASYDGMRTFQDVARYHMVTQMHTSDELLGPTRGPDWDDNGIWRSLHSHTWAADHAYLAASFSEILQVVFNTTNLLNFNPSTQQAAEARFLRAFCVFAIADGWGQVPFREAGTSLLEDAQVLSAQEALDFIIDEMNDIMGDLPDGPAYVANKDAAKGLLIKTYLNKGAFLNRQSPTFDQGDMNQVISLADQIINSGKYSLGNYFDNFAPNNDEISTENIFTGENRGGSSSGAVRSRWFCGLHYNQNPSGWNGFTTLSDFYDSFGDPDDVRLGGDYAGQTDVGGLKTGFLVGQQLDQNGTALLDRKGNALAFTREVALRETGNNLEITGIRVIKYTVDYNGGDNADNDYVFYRLADVMLMKAEAQLRNGDPSSALAIVNQIRVARNADALGSLDLDVLLAERGRELYWEGHRRTDLIRFGKFLNAWQEKAASGPERLLFPIPAQSLAGNPNLVQNPGY
ncbi:MAG TPA: RagB/SusD family nutrient uptake outer membrane protein [Saprospiraceae bacterium]|nr:RagB/SusD family nutrient uptake outer membrane protein [Saprospiraceae bacterium]